MADLQIILHYLSDLKANNNREWYHAHKKEKMEAMKEFENLVQDLMIIISKDEPNILQFQPKDLIFSLVRDTRFSNDKSPYRPAFRAHISQKGKLPIPVGFFIYIEPDGNSIIGGGLFADMFRDATNMMRNYLIQHAKEFENILSNNRFSAYFQLLGAKLKRPPKGYDPDFPYIEYIKYKNWFVEYHLEDVDLLKGDMFDNLIEMYRAVKPFNDFINKALIDFKMPTR
ncbi:MULTISPECIES: DUF2461 domain-containing protein [Bacillota]|jgi:uncharacterized protein (TIGR02453 family)|uniref:DUF2461 domain-containing protein n=2 Tax=Amedibacillus TaxID=2749846 RepID=A0A7G9GS91_9FIRM|nr:MULTISPECIES: DUF2461 domain-containing protein [Bacillota]QNM13673.1 DUF2461 domain-containing protein [[Eubacterium] hominis]MCH4283645.1 DUF2461 domain-containing protein [Amedibacillus hominis]RGB54179.1 DUF2461 domain-containing protein [Absiella sp. AM10-20]RGB56622.1 DUF2461 domain-containing protein [Absiella sp. AM22-9]RGB64750.1 DUF2461 domain-containing protein [Absiella sp. AM09-45]